MTGHRKHHFNQGYFDAIDTQAKAYFLGFLYADGSVTAHALHIVVHARDRDILEKFRRAIKGKMPISEGVRTTNVASTSPYARLNIYSTRLVRALAGHGVTANKSHRGERPHVPPTLEGAFFRGLFDGDGYWSRYQIKGQPGHYWMLGLVGQRHMVEAFRDYCVRMCPRVRAKIKPDRQSYRFEVAGRWIVEQVGASLYGGCRTYLDRKYAGYRVMREDVARWATTGRAA